MRQSFEILLVEDNKGDVEMFRQALRDITPACHISVASDGAEALDYLFKSDPIQAAARPHLIFLDLNLPRVSGSEALKTIKSDERTKNIPVIVFTSSSAPSDIQRSYDHHANCYVIKRFDVKESMSTIQGLVGFWRSLPVLPHDATEHHPSRR